MSMAEEFTDYMSKCEDWSNIMKSIKQRPHQTASAWHTAGPRTTLIPQRQKHSPEQLQLTSLTLISQIGIRRNRKITTEVKRNLSVSFKLRPFCHIKK